MSHLIYTANQLTGCLLIVSKIYKSIGLFLVDFNLFFFPFFMSKDEFKSKHDLLYYKKMIKCIQKPSEYI